MPITISNLIFYYFLVNVYLTLSKQPVMKNSVNYVFNARSLENSDYGAHADRLTVTNYLLLQTNTYRNTFLKSNNISLTITS